MKHSIWLYILVSAAVSYLIRVTPLVLIRREITNRTLRSFLYYVPYVTLAVMTFPAITEATQSPLAGLLALIGGAGACSWWRWPAAWSCLCRSLSWSDPCP